MNFQTYESSEAAIISINDAEAMIPQEWNKDSSTIENARENNLQYYVDTVSGEVETE